MATYSGEEDPVHGKHYTQGRNSFMQEHFTSPDGGYGTADERALANRMRHGGHYGRGPKGFRFSDKSIEEGVCEALFADIMIDASEIEVKVQDGVVTLLGLVDDRNSKRAAEAYAENQDGVEDVVNLLKVKKPLNAPENPTAETW